MFGKYEVRNKLLIKKDMLEINISRIAENVFKYYRKYGDNRLSKKIVVKEVNLGIYPLPPLNQKYFISNTIYLRLKSTVTLSPKEKATVYFKAPIDIGVVLYKDNVNTIIDRVTLTREKYAIYGPVENGLICRFYITDVYHEEPEITMGEAVVKVEIDNVSNYFIELSKIVIPVAGINIFYKGERAHYGLFRVNIESPDSISIRYVKEIEIPGFYRTPITVGQFKEHLKMEWGVS